MAVATEEKVVENTSDLFENKEFVKPSNAPGNVFKNVSAGLAKLTTRNAGKSAEKTVGRDTNDKPGIMDKAVDGLGHVAGAAGSVVKKGGLLTAAAIGSHIKKSAAKANEELQARQMTMRNSSDVFESALQRAELLWLQAEAAAKSRRANRWKQVSNKIASLGSTFSRIAETSATKTAQVSHISRGDVSGVTHVTGADYSYDY